MARIYYRLRWRESLDKLWLSIPNLPVSKTVGGNVVLEIKTLYTYTKDKCYYVHTYVRTYIHVHVCIALCVYISIHIYVRILGKIHTWAMYIRTYVHIYQAKEASQEQIEIMLFPLDLKSTQHQCSSSTWRCISKTIQNLIFTGQNISVSKKEQILDRQMS